MTSTGKQNLIKCKKSSTYRGDRDDAARDRRAALWLLLGVGDNVPASLGPTGVLTLDLNTYGDRASIAFRREAIARTRSVRHDDVGDPLIEARMAVFTARRDTCGDWVATSEIEVSGNGGTPACTAADAVSVGEDSTSIASPCATGRAGLFESGASIVRCLVFGVRSCISIPAVGWNPPPVCGDFVAADSGYPMSILVRCC